MSQQLQDRLDVLKKEFETGQARLRELGIQESMLRETLLRISGAIQVIEELLAESSKSKEDGLGRSAKAQSISS